MQFATSCHRTRLSTLSRTESDTLCLRNAGRKSWGSLNRSHKKEKAEDFSPAFFWLVPSPRHFAKIKP
jgi:hypothetical protein